MTIEVKVPAIGESITEVEIGGWYKSVGDRVALDEPLVDIESQKATLELPSPAAGVLTAILRQAGEVAQIGESIASIDETAVGDPAPDRAPEKGAPHVMPAAERVLAESGTPREHVVASGPGGRVLKEDALAAARDAGLPPVPPAPTPAPIPAPAPVADPSAREERPVRMSVIRRTIASRLVEAKQNAALLTTFNEVDMFAVKALRQEIGEEFLARHEIKLGFMSFFVAASVKALQRFPQVNAEFRGDQIIYKNFLDIGIAIGGGKGLVVPVLRDAQSMSFADIEKGIADFGARAKNGKLELHELEGGTFTISNGGVYGSLLSTPIINPPQSAILGLHGIQDRPVAREGQVVIRPMMYVALTYDHRIIDGREAVTFLKTIKEGMEKPSALMLGL